MNIVFSDGIDYTRPTCLITAGVDTLATWRQHLTNDFFRRRVLHENRVSITCYRKKWSWYYE